AVWTDKHTPEPHGCDMVTWSSPGCCFWLGWDSSPQPQSISLLMIGKSHETCVELYQTDALNNFGLPCKIDHVH
ncbi:hypothetical protein AB205_0015500, partial [Aquarana catesbeiana]